MSIAKPVQIRPENGYKLFIRFSDGKEGIVDLSNLVGKGVFSAWNDLELFKQAYIDVTGAIAWNNDLDICSDALYDKLTNLNNA